MRVTLLLTLTLIFAARPLPAQNVATGGRAAEEFGRKLVTPQAQQAIDSGLKLLAASQHADGSFGSTSAYRRNVAVAGLVGMAFLSSGSTPDRGPHGAAVARTTDFILSAAKPSGLIVVEDSSSHGPMYGHGFATLYLAEAYGMSRDERLRTTLRNAVALIVNSQSDEGGWRYTPDSRDADVSVTVCQMMALRAARNCGIVVPKTVIDQSVDYVRRCQNPDGGFRYRALKLDQSVFPRSAAAISGLYSAGIYEGDDLDRGIHYLERHLRDARMFRYESHYYYGHYYATQVMWQAGGDRWLKWYPPIRDELIERQLPDGSWPETLICTEYATAMSCIVLQMPNNYLPIFQR